MTRQTSRDALAHHRKHRSGDQRRTVLLALHRNTASGLTDAELESGTGFDRARTRRQELGQYVRDSGRRRATPSGRNAIVWELTDIGRTFAEHVRADERITVPNMLRQGPAPTVPAAPTPAPAAPVDLALSTDDELRAAYAAWQDTADRDERLRRLLRAIDQHRSEGASYTDTGAVLGVSKQEVQRLVSVHRDRLLGRAEVDGQAALPLDGAS
jgi:hypothetical protein